MQCGLKNIIICARDEAMTEETNLTIEQVGML